MFEHFGLLDVLSGFWKRKWQIVIIALVGIMLAVFKVGYTGIKDYQKNAENIETGKNYSFSMSLFVKAEEYSLEEGVFAQSQKIRDTFAHALRSDIFSQYLIQNLEVEDLSDILLKNNEISLDNSVISSNDNIKAINEAILISTPSNTCTLDISFSTYDSEIGNKILDIFSSYSLNVLKEKTISADISELGRTMIENEVSSKIFFNKNAYFSSAIKHSLVFVVVFELVYLLIVFAVLLIKPVINRKSDLKEYDIPNVWNL